jgi:SAM-dependent methyltransferase
MNSKDIILDIKSYYSKKLKMFGASPKGADWNSEQSQRLSFEQLCKLLPKSNIENYSLLDYGCGYGALYGYLIENGIKCDYAGYDVTPEMTELAKKTFPQLNWRNELSPSFSYDYTIACGIFSVKQSVPVQQWQKHLYKTLDFINSISTKGFAFNNLTSYSDKPLMKDYLFYANPLEIFDYCKQNFSKHVALLHDYPQYEFTIIVRK